VARFGKWLDWPINFLMWLACFFGFLMMMHVTVDVAAKYLFNSPLEGTIEIVSGYYMVAVAFLPLAYISRTEGHIFVELFTRGLSRGALLRLDGAVNILTFLYMSLLTWQTGAMAIEQTVDGELWETATGLLMIWPSRWMLPVGSAVMTLYLLLRIVEDFRRAARS
jgi:TRAP-type C4-dicarboxylate transport system permease small subunit